MNTTPTTRVVPAIDLIDGRCVRLEQGNFSRTHVMSDDPVAMAQHFAAQGFGRLHLVDLDGAKSGVPAHLHTLQAIARSTPLNIDYSGGLRRTDDLRAALDAGASQLLIGSAAVLQEPLCRSWFETFGAPRMIIGLDVFDHHVRIKGWTEETTLTIGDVVERYRDLGLQTLMCTDIRKDGMLQGPAFELYTSLRESYPHIKLIASGGVRDASDVAELARIGLTEVIVGKALYSGSMEPSQLGAFRW